MQARKGCVPTNESIRKDALREFEIMKGSAMPAFQGKLNAQEIADVVAYLVNLK